MDFDDLIEETIPPPNRVGTATHKYEHKFHEGAVMIAYAMHLLRTMKTTEVRIHPDGMHRKQFDFSAWLEKQNFKRESSTGTTSYAGTYRADDGRIIIVNPKSGIGDVVADLLLNSSSERRVLSRPVSGEAASVGGLFRFKLISLISAKRTKLNRAST